MNGELSSLSIEDALRGVTAMLRGRSPVAARAVELALGDIRCFGLDLGNLKQLRTIASCYVWDVVWGVIAPQTPV